MASNVTTIRAVVPVFLIVALAAAGALGQTVDRSKTLDGFGESRRGDVPEGTAELMTAETDEAIKNGLAWLAKNQNSDGSYGGGTYRGNIAVTSLCGLGVHGIGLEPRAWALRIADRQGPGVRDGEHLADGLHRGVGLVDSWSDVFAWFRHIVSGRSLRDDASAGDSREASEGRPADHRSSKRRRGLAVSAGAQDADLSVTICQINALRAARNAGLYVPKETVAACIRYVKRSQNH